MTSTPTLKDLDLRSVRSAADLRTQADILSRIADVKMEEYMLKAPERIKQLHDVGVPKQVFFGGAGTVFFVLTVLLVLNYGFQMLSVFVSVLQPLYYTFKALETKEKDDDTVWLTYWMVHGVLFMLEHTLLVPVVVFLPAVYFVAKIVLQIWMVNFEGSTVLYNRLIAPFFRRHEKELEKTLDSAKKEVFSAVGIITPAMQREKDAVEEDERNAKEARPQHDENTNDDDDI